jgi:maleylacetoacetate isomerase
MTLQLYTWWRSQASFRVRIALRLKGLETKMITVDLSKQAQLSPAYQILNPGMVLPTLIDGEGRPLRQSVAILEYLEERYPDPPLLPSTPRDRAHVRALAHVLAIDAHPLIVPRVRSYLENEFGINEPTRAKWLRHWMEAGLQTFETMVQPSRTGLFSYGDTPTMADICLVPHVTSAEMLYGVNLESYPTVQQIYDACMRLTAFVLAHPRQQPDAL